MKTLLSFMTFTLLLFSPHVVRGISMWSPSKAFRQSLVGYADIDYSAASEYVAAHYRIPNYFGNSTTRSEPIYDARQGILSKSDDEDDPHDSKIVLPGSLNECGFCLMDAPTQVEDWESSMSEIQSHYLAELADIYIPQALQVDSDQIYSITFWHPMLRGEGLEMQPRTRCMPSMASVASKVHMDTDVGAYGLDGFLNLVDQNRLDPTTPTMTPTIVNRHAMSEQLASPQAGRLICMNIWRPLVPVQSAPLGIWATRYHGSPKNAYFPKHKPCLRASRWYIFRDMQPSECLLFKQYDRRLDQQCDFWHCALPSLQPVSSDRTPPAVNGNVPRKSFDIKAMVILKESVPPEQDRLPAAAQPELTLEESGKFCDSQQRQQP